MMGRYAATQNGNQRVEFTRQRAAPWTLQAGQGEGRSNTSQRIDVCGMQRCARRRGYEAAGVALGIGGEMAAQEGKSERARWEAKMAWNGAAWDMWSCGLDQLKADWRRCIARNAGPGGTQDAAKKGKVPDDGSLSTLLWRQRSMQAREGALRYRLCTAEAS